VTTTLVLLVLLYAVWRAAGIFGRRREREYDESRSRLAGITFITRCSRCASALEPDAVDWRGWPRRKPYCAGGCRPGGEG
jgi:hypothetical protein